MESLIQVHQKRYCLYIDSVDDFVYFCFKDFTKSAGIEYDIARMYLSAVKITYDLPSIKERNPYNK